jgi:hypothetical protein
MKAAMKCGVRAAGIVAIMLLGAAPAQAAPAASADSSPSAEPAKLAAPCRVVTRVDSANLSLVKCDGTQGTRYGYYGSTYFGTSGVNQLYLRSAAGTVTALKQTDGPGSETTDTVGDHGRPWRACKFSFPSLPVEICTAAG